MVVVEETVGEATVVTVSGNAVVIVEAAETDVRIRTTTTIMIGEAAPMTEDPHHRLTTTIVIRVIAMGAETTTMIDELHPATLTMTGDHPQEMTLTDTLLLVTLMRMTVQVALIAASTEMTLETARGFHRLRCEERSTSATTRIHVGNRTPPHLEVISHKTISIDGRCRKLPIDER